MAEDLTLIPFEKRNPTLAALLSVIPGAGQVYNGQLFKGLLVLISFWLIVPWIYGIYDAYLTSEMINRKELVTRPILRSYVIYFLTIGILLVLPITAQNFYQAYLKMHGQSHETIVAKQKLRTMAGWLEKYAQKHGGVYPQNLEQLYMNLSDKVNDIFCGTEIQGYRFDCQFTENGYLLKAIPLSDAAKTDVISIITGEEFIE